MFLESRLNLNAPPSVIFKGYKIEYRAIYRKGNIPAVLDKLLGRQQFPPFPHREHLIPAL